MIYPVDTAFEQPGPGHRGGTSGALPFVFACATVYENLLGGNQ